jgi:hypothetical protein
MKVKNAPINGVGSRFTVQIPFTQVKCNSQVHAQEA